MDAALRPFGSCFDLEAIGVSILVLMDAALRHRWRFHDLESLIVSILVLMDAALRLNSETFSSPADLFQSLF